MKRKYMNKTNWERIKKSQFKKKKELFLGQKSIIGLINIEEVKEPLILDNNIGKYKIVDNGYKWIQIAIEKENYWITAMFNQKNELIQIYIDITNGNILDEINPYFDDLYIDIVIYNNNIYVLDEEELENAYKKGNILEKEYTLSKETSSRLYKYLKINKNKIIKECYKILDILQKK